MVELWSGRITNMDRHRENHNAISIDVGSWCDEAQDASMVILSISDKAVTDLDLAVGDFIRIGIEVAHG